MNLFDALRDDFEFHIDKAIKDGTTPVSNLVFKPVSDFKSKTDDIPNMSANIPAWSGTCVINAPGFDTITIKEDNRTFFDDDMLDFLLEDIMKQKAKYSEEKIKKAIEDDKRNKIKQFSKKIDHIIFHDPHTIVFWKDGSVTRVKCQEGDTYDPEKGLAIAIIKHIFGDTNYFNTIFKKWLPDEDE